MRGRAAARLIACDLFSWNSEVSLGELWPRPGDFLPPTWSLACFKPAEEGTCVGRFRISCDEIGSKTTASGSERSREYIQTVDAAVLAANCDPSSAGEIG